MTKNFYEVTKDEQNLGDFNGVLCIFVVFLRMTPKHCFSAIMTSQKMSQT
jgi:uncharacterized protein (UPF0305 family)